MESKGISPMFMPLLLILLVFITIVEVSALENGIRETTISVSTDSSSYHKGDTILVSGSVTYIEEDRVISISINNPAGNIAGIAQIQPKSDKTFETKFVAGGGPWQQDGKYTVTVRYGPDAIATTTFEFVNASQVKIIVDSTKSVYDSSELVQVFGSVFPYFDDEQIFVTLIDPTGLIIGTSVNLPYHFPDGTNFSDQFWSRHFDKVQGTYTVEVKYKDVTETITIQIRKAVNEDVPLYDESLTELSILSNEIYLTLDKHVYKNGDSIILKGTVEDPTINSEISVMINNPKDNTVFVAQLKPSNTGDFSQTVRTEGPLWEYEGTYTVKVTFGDDVAEVRFVLREPVSIPDWIRTNAKWWSEEKISDNDFAKGIEFLIKENVIRIKDLPEQVQTTGNKIPDWIRNNANWWSQGLISDEDFVKGIEFLVRQGIIQI
ncbi:MAG: hypothetical protein IIC67_05405 [Thaumarchaeota archaeon]|nr:hypothetical protein [Nitrososphaerota archaeon]